MWSAHRLVENMPDGNAQRPGDISPRCPARPIPTDPRCLVVESQGEIHGAICNHDGAVNGCRLHRNMRA